LRTAISGYYNGVRRSNATCACVCHITNLMHRLMQQLRRISRLPAVPQWSIAAVACLFTVYARVYDLLRVTTFRVRHSRGEVYIGHGRLRVCVYVCLSLAAFPHYCTDPGVTWGNGRGYPLVVHYWADLQSVHGFRCYDNTRVCKLIALCTANAYSAEREMSASACTCSMAGLQSLSCATHSVHPNLSCVASLLLGLVFSVLRPEIGCEERLRNDLFCV